MSEFYRDYNYLKYQTKDVLSCKRLEELVLGNKYISNMDKDSQEYKLLIKSLNTGAFSKFSEKPNGYLYWLPSCNSGVPIVPRDSYLHETKFMLHDVYHQLLPDIIVDTFDSKYEKVYVYFRVLSEVFTMVLADYLLMDNFKKQGLFNEEEIAEVTDKKIYKTFSNEYEGTNTSLRDIFYNHTMFGLTGSFKYREPHKNFETWANNVYVADFLWSINNYYEILKHDTTYLDWVLEFKDGSKNDKDFDRFNYLSDFKGIVDKSDEEIVNELFEFIYKNYYNCSEKEGLLLPLESRVKKAEKVIKLFNNVEKYIQNVKVSTIVCDFAANKEISEDKLVQHFRPKLVAYYPETNSLVKDNFSKYKRNSNEKVGLYSASFDVVHAGHLNIIKESSLLVDTLYVGIATKEDKEYMFSSLERMWILQREVDKLGLTNVKLVEVKPDIPRFMNKKHITYLFRGVRNEEDFANEFGRLYDFQKVNNHFKEVLLFGDSKYHKHSSTKVKELLTNNKDVSRYITKDMENKIK